MMKLVIIAIAAIASVAVAIPTQPRKGAYVVAPVRVVRAAYPDPGYNYRGYDRYDGNRERYSGYGGGYGSDYDQGGYDDGHYEQGGYGRGGQGYGYSSGGGYNQRGGHNNGGGYDSGIGYNNYLIYRPAPQSQSSASASSINGPYGSSSYATASSNSGGSFYRR